VAKLYVDMARVHEENRDMYLEQSSGFIVNVIGEIRRISKTLESPNEVVDLKHSIKNLFDDLMLLCPINFELNTNSIIEEELNEILKLNIFRIIQEQMNNILAHAEATYTYVNIDCDQHEITILIADDGKGCDTEKTKDGVGIKNIKSRAELYNGKVTIKSQHGKGYQLKVVMLKHIDSVVM